MCHNHKQKNQINILIMKFFNNCKDINEAKQLYKKLALENHPDRGGDLATMQEINSEYRFALAKLAKGEGKTTSEVNDEINLNEKYMTAINKIIGLEGIIIELVGSWLWVTGNTKEVKEVLKSAGFIFASKKCAWFFRTDENKCKVSKGLELDEIKAKYGAVSVGAKNFKKQLN